jgi:hypothetical protein
VLTRDIKKGKLALKETYRGLTYVYEIPFDLVLVLHRASPKHPWKHCLCPCYERYLPEETFDSLPSESQKGLMTAFGYGY